MADFQVLDHETYREQSVTDEAHWVFKFIVRGREGDHPCHLRFLWPSGNTVDWPDAVLPFHPERSIQLKLRADLENVKPGTYSVQLIIANEETDTFTFTVD